MGDDGEAAAPIAAGTDQERDALVFNPGVAADKHPELFHYTTLSALRGILESNALWATNAGCLNDMTEHRVLRVHLQRPLSEAFEVAFREIMHGNERLTARVSEQGGVDQIAAIQAKRFLSSLWDAMYGPEGTTEPYVVSFASHCGDSPVDSEHRRHGMLSQWRGYAVGEGVAIVFDTTRLKELVDMERQAHRYYPLGLGEVIYDDVLGRLEPLVAQLRENAALQVRRLYRDAREKFASLAGQFGAATALVKHPAFRDEHECRIVAGVTPERLGPELAEAGDRDDTPYKRIHHRRGARGAIPYIRLFEGLGGALPVTRIIVGPSLNQAAILEDVRDLVIGREIEVMQSAIPYAGTV